MFISFSEYSYHRLSVPTTADASNNCRELSYIIRDCSNTSRVFHYQSGIGAHAPCTPAGPATCTIRPETYNNISKHSYNNSRCGKFYIVSLLVAKKLNLSYYIGSHAC